MPRIAKQTLCVASLAWLLACHSYNKGHLAQVKNGTESSNAVDAGELPSADAGEDNSMESADAGKRASTKQVDASTRDPMSTMSHAGAGSAQAGAAGGAPAKANGGSAGAKSPPKAGAPASNGPSPFEVLVNLASRTPQARTAEVIRRYLDSLESGDGMPAVSTAEFLNAIDDEEHCTERFSQECISACEVVNATCAVCIIDEDCRTTLLRVCGLPALACGRGR